jgi:ABC-2 type transport system ATP-binding protein
VEEALQLPTEPSPNGAQTAPLDPRGAVPAGITMTSPLVGHAQAPMLVATGLVKRYRERAALDGFDLTVRPGEITGLIGHNGAGKTTFVEIVTGLIKPDAGRVSIDGVDALRDSRSARRLIGVAPQEQALYLSATVRDNLRLFGALSGLRRAELRAAVAAVAEELMLTDVLDQRAGLVSGGQRRRAQAATALIGDPKLLLLDEPTAGADPETRSALLAAVRARAATGVAVVYTTHYLPELADLGATLAVARSGRVIARGTQRSLIGGLPGEVRLRFSHAADPSAAAGPPAARRNLPASLADRASVVADELRITSSDPPADLAAVLAAGCGPVSVDVRRPDLDDLYRMLAAEAPDVA